jgi:NADH-quinone oxidoreductase subunit H
LPVVRSLLPMLQKLGIGQLAADGIKMLGKEDIVPRGADGAVFRLAPYLALYGCVPAVLRGAVCAPRGDARGVGGALYVIAVSGITVLALLMAGWGSGNKFSMLGGMRAVAQLVSYEIPVGLAVAGVVLWSGTMDLHAIVAQQYRPGVFTCVGWNLVQSPFLATLAAVFFLAGLAECQRTPFDMAEAESELVSGFNTEYSGLRWGLFAMAEYTEMLLIGALFATLFLGGYQSPIGESVDRRSASAARNVDPRDALRGKFLASLFLMVWIRWTCRAIASTRSCGCAGSRWCRSASSRVRTRGAAGARGRHGEAGTPYGRLPALPRPALGTCSGTCSAGRAGAAARRSRSCARRRHGGMHPALRQLTGGGS